MKTCCLSSSSSSSSSSSQACSSRSESSKEGGPPSEISEMLESIDQERDVETNNSFSMSSSSGSSRALVAAVGSSRSPWNRPLVEEEED